MTHRVLFVSMLIAASLFVGCGKANEFDGVITEYEKLVDQTIALQTRITAGEQAAATELAALAPKYQELFTKLSGAQASGMTAEQAKRFGEISKRYQEAMTPPQP